MKVLTRLDEAALLLILTWQQALQPYIFLLAFNLLSLYAGYSVGNTQERSASQQLRLTASEDPLRYTII